MAGVRCKDGKFPRQISPRAINVLSTETFRVRVKVRGRTRASRRVSRPLVVTSAASGRGRPGFILS